MRGSRNFRQGGPGQSDKKISNNVFFLVLSLFYRSQMVNFKEIFHYSRFQRGSNIFQGGGGVLLFLEGIQLLIPNTNPYNLWFSRGGSGPPAPPSGSALGVVHSYLKEKGKFRQVPQIKFFMHAVRRFMLEFIEIVFHEKETQLCNYVLCAKSAFVRVLKQQQHVVW